MARNYSRTKMAKRTTSRWCDLCHRELQLTRGLVRVIVLNAQADGWSIHFLGGEPHQVRCPQCVDVIGPLVREAG